MNAPALTVPGVMLLGIKVDAHVVLDLAEHRRRKAAGIGAIVDPCLLDRLLDLPHGIPVGDPGAWAELAGQNPGIVQCSAHGPEVTRLLRSPLTIRSVTVNADAHQEVKAAVQAASLFAAFCQRWVRLARKHLPELACLEAELAGVGVIDRQDHVLVPAEDPPQMVANQWSWLNEEKAYRRLHRENLLPV